MTTIELANLCARIHSNAETDLATIRHELQGNKGYDKVAWALAHLTASSMDYIRDLERLQKALEKDKDAN